LVRKGGDEMAKKRVSSREYSDTFLEIFRKLAEDSEAGIPIIVEGKRDEEALREIGVRGEVIVFQSLRKLGEELSRRECRRVILLFDLDSEGEEMMLETKQFLEGLIRNIDTNYWRRLRSLKYTGLTEIEAFKRFIHSKF